MVWLDDGEKVHNQCICDFCDTWVKHSSLAEQMWNVLIKFYQALGEWEVKSEKSVTQKLSMEYVEEEKIQEFAGIKDSKGKTMVKSLNCEGGSV